MIQKLNLTNKLVIKNNGKEAIDYLKAQSPTSMPTLILLDIDMPVMNGYEFLEEFSKLPEDSLVSEIIIVSTSSQFIDEIKIVHFPFVKAYMSKPLKKADWLTIKSNFGILQ